MSFSLWASRTALSGHIQMNYSKVKNLSQISSPGNIDTTTSPNTLTVWKNDANQRNISKSRTASAMSVTLSPRHIYIMSVSRWLGMEWFLPRPHPRVQSVSTAPSTPARNVLIKAVRATRSAMSRKRRQSLSTSHMAMITLIHPHELLTHSHCCSINSHHLYSSYKTPLTDILPSSLRGTMSESNSNSLNFFDLGRTSANARSAQQPPDQSAPMLPNSSAYRNNQPSAEGPRPCLPDSQSGGISLNLPLQPAASTVSSQPPPKDPASSGINQRGIEPPTPEQQICHIKDLLLNLKIRIASCETHAKRQGLKREEIWTSFEHDRMRIEAHMVPDLWLGDHWKVIVENQVPFETLQLGLTEAFDSNANLRT